MHDTKIVIVLTTEFEDDLLHSNREESMENILPEEIMKL